MKTQIESDQPDFKKLAIATLIGTFILAAAVYGAYRYSQNQSSNIILPGGVTYLGPTTVNIQYTPTPVITVRFTAASDVAWKTQGGKIYPYTFSFPETLPLVVFPGEVIDSVAVAWGNIEPQRNILLNMEFIDQRDPKLLNQPKIEYVRNWYKFFSGLKGVASVEPFTNTNGLKGFKAIYINIVNETPNVDIFLEIPDQSDKLIHLANGILDPEIFNRIVDSVKWTEKTK